jgi:hypothetical protein
MPLPRPVPFVGQQNDPTGCWFACAHMLRKYYEGGNAVPQRMPELENEDGTHQRMDSSSMARFLANEKLEPLSGLIPKSTASEIDAVLTQYGPVIFSWSGGIHVSVIVGTLNDFVYYHDPLGVANQMMPAAEFKVRQMGGSGGTVAMLIRDPILTAGRRQFESTPRGLALASDGVKRYPLEWPRGWWRVYDGGTWYYYLGDRGAAMSSRSPPPAGSLGPPAKAHNTGWWGFKPPKTLVIVWQKVAGAADSCTETFYNATKECEKMNATSTLYCPLEAKRHRG